MECVAEILQSYGYATELVDDAESGLLFVEEEKPSLIMIDSNLPGMRGEQAVKLIGGKRANLPIIGMSGEDWTLEMRAAGATVFLKKPFEIPDLLKTIQELLTCQPKS